MALTMTHAAILAAGSAALIAAFSSWTSRVNGTFFFGRTVDALARTSDRARRITRRYVGTCWLAWAACLLPILAGWKLENKAIMYFSFLIVVVAQQAAFARGHREAKGLARETDADENVVEVALDDERRQPTWWVPSVGAILGPVLLGLVSLAAALLLTGGETFNFAEHWSVLAENIGATGVEPLVDFGAAFLLAGTGMLLAFRTAARLRTTMAQYTVKSSAVFSLIGAVLLLAAFGCATCYITVPVTLVRVVLFGIPLLALAAQVWNMSRSGPFVPAPAELHGDDRWRWGLYYWNPADPALFVQRRTGVGFTLNFARGSAWVLTVACVACFAAMIVVR